MVRIKRPVDPAVIRSWLVPVARRWVTFHSAGAIDWDGRASAFVVMQRDAPLLHAWLRDRSEAPGSLIVPLAGRYPMRDALNAARQTRLPLIPVGVAIRPALKLRGLFDVIVPLPGALCVVFAEPPFHLPPNSTDIPAAWERVAEDALRRAAGRAQDELATRMRSRNVNPGTHSHP